MSNDGVWQTELERNADGGWTLSVGGDQVAATAEKASPAGAQDWARKQMGEGVTFHNGMYEPASTSGYWTAGPVFRSATA